VVITKQLDFIISKVCFQYFSSLFPNYFINQMGVTVHPLWYIGFI
jgi:hypothetical protein